MRAQPQASRSSKSETALKPVDSAPGRPRSPSSLHRETVEIRQSSRHRFTSGLPRPEHGPSRLEPGPQSFDQRHDCRRTADDQPSLNHVTRVDPGALEAAGRGVRTGGDPRNREYVAESLDSTADPAPEALCFDPQTSGGLLAAVTPELADDLIAEGWWRVGAFEDGAPGVVLR